jgi:hypothetical protein
VSSSHLVRAHDDANQSSFGGQSAVLVEQQTVDDSCDLVATRRRAALGPSAKVGQELPFERHPKIYRNRTLVPVSSGADVSLSGEDLGHNAG